MKHETKEKLIRAHAEIQLGTYFSEIIDLGHDLKFALSSNISDTYWNYAYGLHCSIKDLPERIAAVKQCAGQHNRTPALYTSPETQPEHLSSLVVSREVVREAWMLLTEAATLVPINASELIINQVKSNAELEDFISVFKDAYGSGDPNSPGYSGLSDGYLEAIRLSRPPSGVRIIHLLGYYCGRPAAIASCFCKPPYAGLYNVGTMHNMRRRHFGLTLSQAAITEAQSLGCDQVFLQTEADSVVETLYQKLGFRRSFIGECLVF